jgi:hypothetical protein
MQDKEGKMLDRREMLRVKLKTLVAESHIIRKEEKRSWGQLRNDLHRHRVINVRKEARDTHMAYGLIRGRTRERIEAKTQSEPNWPNVHSMLMRYGPPGADWSYLPGAPTKSVTKRLKAIFA